MTRDCQDTTLEEDNCANRLTNWTHRCDEGSDIKMKIQRRTHTNRQRDRERERDR